MMLMRRQLTAVLIVSGEEDHRRMALMDACCCGAGRKRLTPSGCQACALMWVFLLWNVKAGKFQGQLQVVDPFVFDEAGRRRLKSECACRSSLGR